MNTAILAIRIIGDAAEATAAFGDAENAASSFESKMSKLQNTASIAGAAAGGALAAGVYGAVENAQAENKLEAQLGLDPAESERLGGIAGDLYANAYGDSLSTVNEAIRAVSGDISGMADASDADLERITGKVLSTAQAFDLDLGATTTAVGQMIRTGLARDADEALDLITTGLQGNARAATDLLDTYNEYPALFQRLGLDGATSMGLINQGMEAGARSTDLVADALKEFQIRSTDASTASAAGYEALGLNAEEMTARMAAGGQGAAEGLDIVLDRLRDMTDPVAQNAAAVALFGTQAEDLGGALYALDPSSAVDALGQVTDASERLDATMSKDQAFTMLQRTVTQTFTDIGAAALPVIMPITEGLREWAPILGPLAVVLAAVGAAVFVVSSAMKVYAAVQAVQTAAQWASNAAWLASPITWIILAIIAAIALVVAGVVLLIQHWDEVSRVAADVWQGVLDWIGSVGDGFQAVIAGIVGWWNGLVDDWNRGINDLIRWVRDALSWLGQLANNAVPGWVQDLFGMNGATFIARVAVDEPPAMLAAGRMAFTADETAEGFAQRSSAATTLGGLSAADLGGSDDDRPRGGDTYNVTVTFSGLVTDEEAVAREIRRVIESSDKTNGRELAVGVGR